MPIQVEHEGKTVNAYLEHELQEAIDKEVKGLKITNQNLKEEKEELQAKQREAAEKARQAEEEKAKADGDIEKLNRLMEERRQEDADRFNKLQSQIKREKVTNALSDIVTSLGAGGTKNEDLRDLIKSRYEFDYDHETGKISVTGDGVTSLEDLQKQVKESGRYDAYLAGSAASGGGATGGNGAGAPNKKLSEMNDAERVRMYREEPERFRELVQAEKGS